MAPEAPPFPGPIWAYPVDMVVPAVPHSAEESKYPITSKGTRVFWNPETYVPWRLQRQVPEGPYAIVDATKALFKALVLGALHRDA